MSQQSEPDLMSIQKKIDSSIPGFEAKTIAEFFSKNKHQVSDHQKKLVASVLSSRILTATFAPDGQPGPDPVLSKEGLSDGAL